MLWGPPVGVALLGVFGSLALALASVGLYGAMAYSVTAALARRRARIVLRDGMALVCYGIAVGLAACLPMGRALSPCKGIHEPYVAVSHLIVKWQFAKKVRTTGSDWR